MGREYSSTKSIDLSEDRPRPQHQSRPRSLSNTSTKHFTNMPIKLQRRLVQQMQITHGNQTVQRLFADDVQRCGCGGTCATCSTDEQETVQRAPDTAPMPVTEGTVSPGTIQAWRVPGHLGCMDLVPYMNENSPHPDHAWGYTSSTFTFNGDPNHDVAESEYGGFEDHVTGNPEAVVGRDTDVDLPEWTASERPQREEEQAAFDSMVSTLSGHEDEHVRIATEHQATMQETWRTLDFTEIGDTAAQARTAGNTAVDEERQRLIDDHQTDTSAIDPYDGAILTCPAPPLEDEESAEAETAIGGDTAEFAQSAAPLSQSGLGCRVPDEGEA